MGLAPQSPRFAVIALLLLGIIFPLGAQEAYPRITRLNTRDPIFKQYLDEVMAARRRIFNRHQSGGPDRQSAAEAPAIYAYRPQPGEDLLNLAARCNIPFGTIVSLNRITHPDDLGMAGTLLLPSAPGLFVPEEAESDLERLIGASRSGVEGVDLVILRGEARENFRFFPGEDLSPTERVFFLNRGFRFPLSVGRLTSAFGPRVNPVTGVYRVHQGIDLAAPEGTEVYAVRDGEVTEIGEDSVYGRYIVIRHGDNWVSLYGHLSKVDAALRSAVRSGTVIGRVGSTGQSTGPHLHFELRQNGQAQDPGKYLRLFKN